jgi:predicted Zn-dependent protease
MLLQAQLAAQAGDLNEARTLADTVLKNAPDDENALMIKAQIEAASGNRDEAQRLYEQAVAAHPNSIAPRYSLAIEVIE